MSLQFPGYGWSSRYVSLGGDTEGPAIRCLTLYIVEDRSAFNMVLAPTQEQRPKTLVEDQENFETIRGAHYIHSSVYEHVSGSHPGKPLLMGNRPSSATDERRGSRKRDGVGAPVGHGRDSGPPA